MPLVQLLAVRILQQLVQLQLVFHIVQLVFTQLIAFVALHIRLLEHKNLN